MLVLSFVDVLYIMCQSVHITVTVSYLLIPIYDLPIGNETLDKAYCIVTSIV